MLKRRPVIYVFPFVNFGLPLDKKSCSCRPICVLRFVSSLDLNFFAYLLLSNLVPGTVTLPCSKISSQELVALLCMLCSASLYQIIEVIKVAMTLAVVPGVSSVGSTRAGARLLTSN